MFSYIEKIENLNVKQCYKYYIKFKTTHAKEDSFISTPLFTPHSIMSGNAYADALFGPNRRSKNQYTMAVVNAYNSNHPTAPAAVYRHDAVAHNVPVGPPALVYNAQYGVYSYVQPLGSVQLQPSFSAQVPYQAPPVQPVYVPQPAARVNICGQPMPFSR
jgi:hypothetical protein